MKQVRVRLALIAGVAGILATADIDKLVSALVDLLASRELAELIGLLAVLAVSWRIVSVRELTQRYRSPPWVWIGMAVCGAVLLLGPNRDVIFGYSALSRLLRYLNFPVMQTLAGIVLLGLLLKLSHELQPQYESQQRETAPTWRLVAGLTLFIGMTFQFIPTTWLPAIDWNAVLQGRLGSASPSWPTWIQWLIAFGAAYGFVTMQRVDERIAVDRPGLGMLKFGLGISVLGFLVGSVILASASESPGSLYVMVVAGLALAPLGLIAKILVTFGGLKFLFLLQPADLAVDGTEPNETAQPAIDPKPQKPVSTARSYFVQDVSPNEAATSTSPEDSVPERVARTTAPASANTAVPRTTTSASQLITEAELRAALATNPIDPRKQDRLHRILAADPARTPEMLEHAKEYMAVLLSQSLREQAIALYRACAARDPNFKPAGDQVLPLVRLLLMEKEPKSALRVMNRFDSANPQHRDTAQLFYISARILKDMHQLERATQLLKTIISRYPQDKIVHDARTLLKSLEAG